MLTGFVRTLILYIVITSALRLMGKRQVGQLQPSELVIAIMVSEVATVPMQDFGIPLLYGIVPIVTLLCAEMLSSALCSVSLKARSFLCGRPDFLIRRGQLDRKKLASLRISVAELAEELRLKGIFDPGSVASAVLETNGQLSILLKPDQRPLTYAGTGSKSTQEPEHYTILIVQGTLVRQNLAVIGHDERWLRKLLSEHGLHRPKEVLLLSVDDLGGVVLWPRQVRREPGQEEGV